MSRTLEMLEAIRVELRALTAATLPRLAEGDEHWWEFLHQRWDEADRIATSALSAERTTGSSSTLTPPPGSARTEIANEEIVEAIGDQWSE